MKTPEEFLNNYKKNIITKDMLESCLYSVNKRAKNYRDKERECYNQTFKLDKRKKKEAFYKQKDLLLSIVKPDCIHKEKGKDIRRIYEYEDDFNTKESNKRLCRFGQFYDRYTKHIIEFEDVFVDVCRYYLFYDFKGHSFHTPIEECKLNNYNNLEIKEISELITEGREIQGLISMPFVKKIIALIKTGKYKYVEK